MPWCRARRGCSSASASHPWSEVERWKPHARGSARRHGSRSRQRQSTTSVLAWAVRPTSERGGEVTHRLRCFEPAGILQDGWTLSALATRNLAALREDLPHLQRGRRGSRARSRGLHSLVRRSEKRAEDSLRKSGRQQHLREIGKTIYARPLSINRRCGRSTRRTHRLFAGVVVRRVVLRCRVPHFLRPHFPSRR